MKRLAWVLCIMVLICGPLSADTKGFPIRGIKGLWWQGIENYQKALPWLAEHDLNFLMLCYSSFPASGMDWRSSYTDAEMRQFQELTRQAKTLKVNLCLSFNPGIWSKPPLIYSSESDYEFAWNKVKAIHGLGINWFALCLDDIGRELQPADKEQFKTLQSAQVHFVNRLWNDMKTLKPRPKLIFCPSAYTTEDARQHQDYIKTVGQGINREVMMFWTGPQCCSSSISAADAKVFAEWIKRKPFVWDNYPVNDMYNWRPLVGPLKNRSADLSGAVSGYLANPMKQWTISQIPLTTTAMYLNDPKVYNPEKAIAHAVDSFTADQRRAIWLLVDLYGSTFWGEKGFPPQPQATDTASARRLLPKYRLLRKELSGNQGLGSIWKDVQATVENDIASLERRTRDRRTESPLKADGQDFEGGAADLFGYIVKNRSVNYVYAKSTGRSTMGVDFYIDKLPTERAYMLLTAMDDDYPSKVKVRFTLNGRVFHEYITPFSDSEFEAKYYVVPLDILKIGSNRFEIVNLEEQGTLGMPPWFMVAEAELLLH